MPRPLLLLVAVLAIFFSTTAQGATFLANAPDIPVIDGFGETKALGSIFDQPDGRIVEAWLTGTIGSAEALSFYAKTLSQLGWAPAGDDTDKETGVRTASFQRGSETLKISVSAETDAITVLHVQIRPIATP